MSQITLLSLSPLKQTLPDNLVRTLRAGKDITILEGDGSFSKLNDILSSHSVDVILARVDGLGALQGIRKIIRDGKGRKVVITGVKSWNVIFEYIKSGVKGHLDNSTSSELLTKAVRVIYEGEVWFHRQTSSKILEAFAGIKDQGIIECLTKREKEILHFVAKGYKNRIIAESLHISETTVKTHLYHIYEKLGVEDRLAAALIMKRAEGYGE